MSDKHAGQAMLAARTHLVKPSPTLAISAKAKALKAAGKDVLAFAAGEPDFDTPEHIKQAAITALQQGDTKYTAAAGTPAMKNAIITKFQRDNGVTFAANEVIASVGGKHILFNAIMSLINPGDEVLIPVPYWVSYPDMVRIAGGTPVFVTPADKVNFEVTAAELAAHITPRTKLLIINSPNNPSGSGIERAEFERIAELAHDRGLFVISDEIYEKLTFNFQFTSFVEFFSRWPGLRDRTLIAHGVAKTYSMTGWRIGFAGGPAWLIEAMSALQGASTSNPTSFAQAGAVVALTGPQDSVETMRVAFARRAELITRLLNEIPGVQCAMPRGAFYAFPDITNALTRLGRFQSDSDFSAWLLDEHLLAVIPGGEFGVANRLRLSFAVSDAVIEKGLQRLRKALL